MDVFNAARWAFVAMLFINALFKSRAYTLDLFCDVFPLRCDTQILISLPRDFVLNDVEAFLHRTLTSRQ